MSSKKQRVSYINSGGHFSMSVDTNKNMDKNWVESEIATCSKDSSSSEKDNKKEKE